MFFESEYDRAVEKAREAERAAADSLRAASLLLLNTSISQIVMFWCPGRATNK